MNPLQALLDYGQSVWLDYIRRGLITSGELQRLVDEDGLRGITSNPAIFEKAIIGSTDYAEALTRLEQQRDLDAKSRYEQLAIQDIRDAADVLRPVYEQTKRRDGFVSLEVSPYLAHETQTTMDEARRLWRLVGRPNAMIKVPGTPEGIPAVTALIGEGININVTLLFSRQVYERVADAYIAGLEALVARGGDPGAVSSVASFFISRIDTAIDAILTARLKTVTQASEQATLQGLLGKVAIANGKLTYQRYKAIFSSERWQALARQGAHTQRVLWASTSTKNPNYRDVIYVEELIGLDTVNTMPASTVEAFRDHGRPRCSLEEDVEGARNIMQTLERAGISMTEITNRLLDDGVQLFAEAFDKLLQAVDKRCQSIVGVMVDQTYALPDDLAAAVRASLEAWRVGGKVRRLWTRDATLWTGTDEGGWLGWLGITEDQQVSGIHLRAIAEEMRSAGFSHALLLGMGGSSLCPEVMTRTFGKQDGYPELYVLDSTDPAQVRAFERKVDLANTIFIVSSKSGTTLEPNIFTQYFFERVGQVISSEKAGSRFIAITDPGSALQQFAESQHFRHIFYGLPSIGGRYSALSDFGLVLTAIMGVDVPKLLDRAEEMAHACASCVPVEENPGAVLGTILGVLATHGRDKVTIIASPGIRHFGAWLEQLLAESTGKAGKGLIPVDRESLGPPEVYDTDRVFVYLRMASAPVPCQDAALDTLERAGQPVVRIAIADPYDLGAEFFRWEIATAVAGSIIGINPFDQPDVEASKVATRQLTSAYEKTGAIPSEAPIMHERNITLFSDEQNAAALKEAAGADRSLVGYLRAHLNRLGPGDYFALLAYIEMNEAHERALQLLRHAVRDNKRVATCVGFGPRYLHSTGQAYKGGPNTGVFLQVTCDDAFDLPVPGHRYSFGVVKAAQARGDFQVLAERNRRVLRVHLSADVQAGLTSLYAALQHALH
ncbi:bifunctional transaldolase/phosoglucose isomerase [Candidatus Methylomirabilis sp.]|uniref:bifunctional transaldolase/phosoglucose isomerase n=1 Tax=Candidatus Methylomirabilis sp. TaxID=2032687 RepID=UPI002A67D74A|nr:bifunctional transaldolase/phosoglucose isomerase [Candidatus Methylomirabilis sp.]